ncbi:MAG: DNA polymerase I, partial [Ignavibacteriales bacterium]|nr:DNA polymerase I [Ignavibacteriales bacterium]
IHRRTAALVFKVAPEQVTPDMRRKAKEVNFGIMYGLGAFGLKTRLGISQAEAKNIILTYNETFPRIADFIQQCKEFAREKGYSETLLGRRRYLLNINSSNAMAKQFEERVAVNMPIQGTAADMIKIAMNNIHLKLKELQLKTKMVLQVHDELVFDVYKPELETVKAFVKELMENALPLHVPVTVEMGTGDNWIEAH